MAVALIASRSHLQDKVQTARSIGALAAALSCLAGSREGPALGLLCGGGAASSR